MDERQLLFFMNTCPIETRSIILPPCPSHRLQIYKRHISAFCPHASELSFWEKYSDCVPIILNQALKISPGSDNGDMNLRETELTLGLPGESRATAESTESKSGTKRVFSEITGLNVCRLKVDGGSDHPDDAFVEDNGSSNTAAKSPAAKAQVVGWPPVRSFRRNATLKSGKFVKVATDGAPYLRKVDLKLYRSYQQLLSGLEDMFSCLTIRNYLNERKAMDPATANGVDYVPTYEDRDGDWMLVGDVPWKMFVDSCKRLRLMKSSEALGLERTALQCISSS